MVCHRVHPCISRNRVRIDRVRNRPLIDHRVLFSLISIFNPRHDNGVLGARAQIFNFSFINFERHRLTLGSHVTGNLDFSELNPVLVSFFNSAPCKLNDCFTSRGKSLEEILPSWFRWLFRRQLNQLVLEYLPSFIKVFKILRNSTLLL